MASNNSLKDLKPFQEMTNRLWGYAFQGILLVFCNSIIFISILYHDLLRSKKEYALPALLAFRDAADGLAAIFAGLGRNWLIFNGKARLPVSRWQCLLTPWNFIWIFAQHTTDSIFLMISVDRLIAVGWPLFHYGLTTSYSNMMVLFAVSPAFVGYISAFTYTLTDNNSDVQSICFLFFVHPGNYYKVMTLAKAMVALLSVVIYIPVIVMYLRHNADSFGVDGEEAKKYIKSQRKFTVTLGISCMFTMILYVFPATVAALIQHSYEIAGPFASMIVSWAYITININKIADIFLYSLRHRNLRLGIKFLFMNKQLTMQAIQTANNAIVPVNVVSPHVHPIPGNHPIAQNHQRIALAVNPNHHPHPVDRALTPLGIRRPVFIQRSTRV